MKESMESSRRIGSAWMLSMSKPSAGKVPLVVRRFSGLLERFKANAHGKGLYYHVLFHA